MKICDPQSPVPTESLTETEKSPENTEWDRHTPEQAGEGRYANGIL
jgi:hypothetical protein